jgi:hypothetical protein
MSGREEGMSDKNIISNIKKWECNANAMRMQCECNVNAMWMLQH